MRKGTKHKAKTKLKMAKGLRKAHNKRESWFRKKPLQKVRVVFINPTPEASKETDEKAKPLLDSDSK